MFILWNGKCEGYRMWHRKAIARLLITFFLIALVVGLAGCIMRTRLNPDSQLQCAPSTAHHFDRALIVVLENQNYETAIKDSTLSALAQEGSSFSDFHALFHPSY